ncbi:hypothetical protein DYB26_007190 [Aphanomyces astaci]|uniref:Uncharacterized protein n=1 Tax=Aphanomyces astaci TaxID=112090 RepID=A0A397EDG7_APHAT|nr:hypothetical protein DYB34_008485 [Aphanomyces astaci]RHY78311.1 hypothetical protein DYB38_008224 [Aphanomyces astaci]RHY80699.1 hypothetical protein DYB26_007190 [Aphanomyces astaci]RHZ02031.1 hypothetical protein DYB31_006950 [Aphanomyces astaci]
MQSRVAQVEEYVVETVAEVGATAKAIVHELKVDIEHIVEVSTSPRQSPSKGSFMEKIQTLKNLSPTKADMVNSVNKIKSMWRYRHSTVTTDGGEGGFDGDDGYSSSEEDEEEWSVVLDKPIETILADYSNRKWKDAPDYLLRTLHIHTLRQLPIPHTRKLYLILTGPGYTLFITVANWALASSIFVMYAVLVGFGSAVYCSAVVTGVLPRPVLRSWKALFKLEWEALKLFLRLEWEACLDYRVRQPRIDELETKKRVLAQVVDTVLDNIRADVAGSMRYKDLSSAVSLGSVVVCGTLYVLFVAFTFIGTNMDFTQMNTKNFDGLAIILPFLLAEELAVFLARVTLVIKWFSVFLHDNAVVQMLVDDNEPQEKASLSEFINDARTMCKSIGVGAWDMTGIASAMTAVWTIFFLYQSYYVDLKSQGLEPGPPGLADTMFWSMVLYSVTIITLCALPFTSWFGGAVADDKYTAMLKSCQTFMMMNRLSTVQQEVSLALRKEIARQRGVPVGQHVSSEEKRVLRSFRAGILKTLDKADFVSFFLYTICMALVDFEAPDGENAYYRDTSNGGKVPTSIKRLRHRGTYTHCTKLEIPIDQLQAVEIALFNASAARYDDVDVVDASSSPSKEKAQGAVVSSMYDVVVLDTTVGASFIDKQVYDLSQVLDNPSVRYHAVYRNPYTNQLVLGLEMKMMERRDKLRQTTTNVLGSVYLLAVTNAQNQFEIGNGPIFLRGAGLEKKTLKLEAVDLLFERVGGRVLPRYIRRCTLAMHHEATLFAQADDYLRGNLHAAPPTSQGSSTTTSLSRKGSTSGPEPSRSTGSASHLTASDYRTAKTTTDGGGGGSQRRASGLKLSTHSWKEGSSREAAATTNPPPPTESQHVQLAQRVGTDAALQRVHSVTSNRDLSSWTSNP